MKRLTLLVILVSVVSPFYLAGCKQATQTGETPAAMQEPIQMADVTVTGVQAPAYNEKNTLIPEPAVEAVGEFVEPSDRDIQAALKNAGFYAGAIDSKIGPLSEKAIRDFQQQNGLKVDGKVGRKTWAILKKYLSSEVQTD